MILWVVSVMYAWNVDYSVILHRELDLKGKRNMLHELAIIGLSGGITPHLIE